MSVSTLSRVRPALRAGRCSVVLRITVLLTVIALAAGVVVLFAVDIAIGEYTIPVGRVLEVLAGGGSRAQRFIVVDSRLPRAVTAVVAGGALGIAGAVTQSILRNPLASPDVLGITSGASLAAVAVLAGTGGATTGVAAALGVPLAALAGGLGTAVLIHLLAWGRTGAGTAGVSGLRLVLLGIGVNAMLVAGINWLLTRASLADATRAQQWLTGSLGGADWGRAVPAALGFGLVLAVAAGSAHTLAALRFGEDTARALGVRVQTRQAVLIGAAVTGAALATAAVGPLAFVGLAAPQIARRLLRAPGEPIVGSALVGALVVIGSDVAARTVFPVDLPVGIVTAALGGPFLLLLLVRANRKAT
ncbi:FecCD family ABC transporter permease [Nocardia terpenica]|uniref:Iron ABC transporter n=1 Tax=Nocardia terpenica TaxID=455432 RepID=A0A291RJ46_9NOCA|nr:iron chelate uptake ABC transporter family permease subunit [Nocardia terpenica]ATL67596.1 iron ABC transporter [Nocardia terpenica]